MNQRSCRYPDGNVPLGTDSVAAREVTVTLDPEDAVSILRALSEACCPSALRAAALAIVDNTKGK